MPIIKFDEFIEALTKENCDTVRSFGKVNSWKLTFMYKLKYFQCVLYLYNGYVFNFYPTKALAKKQTLPNNSSNIHRKSYIEGKGYTAKSQ